MFLCWKLRCVDLYLGEDDVDRHDDPAVEFLCPFCGEDFDMVGLYCHIDDEHPIELKNGVLSLSVPTLSCLI